MPTDAAASSRRTASDALASVSERLVSQLSQFTIFVMAARLLGPAEFGIFALASACALVLLRVAEAGWGPFIMSCPDGAETPYQVVTVAALCGIVMACIGAGAAEMGGGFGLSDDVVALAQGFALWIALATTYTAQKGVLTWQGRIRAAAILEIISEMVGFAVAALALIQGAGVFALIYGRLAYQTTALILSLFLIGRLPRFGLDPAIRRELWVFSGHFLSARILINVRMHFLTLAIGAFLGPVVVGYFRAADRLVSAAYELVAVPGQLLAWKLLRRARDSGDVETQAARIEASAAYQLKVLVALGAPIFLWIALMHDDIVRGILGPDWGMTGFLVSILAFGPLLMLPGVLTEPLLSISGNARRLPIFTAWIFGLSVSATLIAAPFGAIPLAVSQVVVNGIILIMTLRLFQRHMQVRRSALWAALRSLILPLLLGAGTIAILRLSPLGTDLHGLVRAVSFGGIGAAVYFTALVLLDRPFWAGIITSMRPMAPHEGTS